MEEVAKNVKLIFIDLDGCPLIDMSSAAYDKLFITLSSFININARCSMDFDEMVKFIRNLSTAIGFDCSAFSDWWFNHPTARYYWPKNRMSIIVSYNDRYHSNVARISGLVKKGDFDMGLAKRQMKDLINSTYGIQTSNFILPKKIIHNNPATIVFWSDNTKTVAKCRKGDIYDPEVGFYVACAKKLFGNDYRAGGIIKTALEKSLKKGNKR